MRKNTINPKNTTNKWKEEKYKIVGAKKSRLGKPESIGSALKTRGPDTIKHWVTKIVPRKHRVA